MRSIAIKKLVYATAFTFLLASNAPATVAGGAMRNANIYHLIHSGAYHFEVHVQGKALSALTIDLPDHVKMRSGIDVTNQNESK